MHLPGLLRTRAAVVLGALALLAAPALPAAAQSTPALPAVFSDPAVASYRMNAANLQQFLRATTALQALGDQVDMRDQAGLSDPDSMRVDDMVRAFEGNAQIRGAITGAGMTSRGYTLFMLAMMQAMFGAVAVQMAGPEGLNQMPAGVARDNIQFFLDNQEQFSALGGGS